MKSRTIILMGFISLLLLVGCASVDSHKRAPLDLTVRQQSTPSNQLVNQGLEYLRERNYEDAQKVFSAAVKLSPTSSTVHILNGISYHLEFLKGVPDSKALAATAYDVAFSLDRSDPMALIQLGRLQIDSGDYAKAKKSFIRAISISPNNSDALYGLLLASLLRKDTKTGLWAADKLATMNPVTPEYQKMLALTYSLSGQQEQAMAFFSKYKNNPGTDSSSIAKFQSQLNYIQRQSVAISLAQGNEQGFIKTAATRGAGDGLVSTGDRATPVKSGTNPQGSGGQNTDLPGGGVAPSKGGVSKITEKKIGIKAGAAKKTYNNSQNNASDDSSDDSADDSSDDSGSFSSSPSTAAMGAPGAGMGSGGGASGGGGGGGGTYSSTSQASQQQKWFDCDTKPGLGKAPGGGYGVPVGGTSGDQTLYLEPLPAPCQGRALPKMAMIDAVLIRTVDTSTTSQGVNLLQGLQIFGGAQRTTTTGQLPINASVMGIGTATSATLNSVSGLVTYSMNIANAVSTTSQVVAKPTLTALDRIPSTFYSGQVQTVGLNGGGVSGAQVSNVPTGTSLSVTPTFIDDETMMLAVKVSRSFVDSTAPVGGFNAGISTQNHNVTANVKIRFGETLILDGLTDREYDKTKNGVPVLQDIPIIQYLFSNVTKSQYSENVVVLVTPRRVVSSEEDLKKLESEMMRKTGKLNLQELSIYNQIAIYNKLLAGRSNADSSLLALDRDSTFFREVKNEVLINNDWIAESATKSFLESAASMLYYH